MIPVWVVCSAPGSRRADYRSLFFPSVYFGWRSTNPELVGTATRTGHEILHHPLRGAACQRILLQGLAVTLPVCNGGIVFVELQDDLPKNLSSSPSSSD
ncbi:hypothetical protein CesoFtcFv8_000466 [Champsocephalus esox]|uniref:Uncharacterized protein n=1 Tax=Champsocephalus esox TaxID=159716 RepID=A0AAN8D1H1_9TELE|nr:hypothetical protein CesoFtcFv8_000466 [Champsocephalus esox]